MKKIERRAVVCGILALLLAAGLAVFLVKYLLSEFENNRTGIWDTEIFGKSLNELVREGLSSKLMRMPEDVRGKIQESLQKIINEGNGGMICILL